MEVSRQPGFAEKHVPFTRKKESRKWRLLLSLVCLSLMALPFLPAFSAESFSIQKAEYNSRRAKLEVEVYLGGRGTKEVTLQDADTLKVLKVTSTKGKSVRFSIRGLKGEQVPCRVRAESGDLDDERDVENSPRDCNGGPPPNEPPTCSINLPSSPSVTIVAGATLDFAGSGSDPESGPLSFRWEFDGAASTVNSATATGIPFFTAGNYTVSFTVTDDHAASCKKSVQIDVTEPPPSQPPTCRILQPTQDPISISLNDTIDFQGEGNDPDGGPVSYEWDFAGGADVRPKTPQASGVLFDTVGSFITTLTVTDDEGERCADTRQVIVGEPPTGLPPMVSEQAAPGTPEAGDGDHVVIAVNDLGMHCADLGSYPFSILPPFNTLNAHVIRRGTSGSNAPQVLDDSIVDLFYSAASNPNDPVGPDSINSTSQNWPVGSPADAAIVRKSDFWDSFQDTGQTIVELLFGLGAGNGPDPDMGLFGATMPGITDPYYDNEPQPFSHFNVDQRWFTAEGIPMISVDDQGRFNSYPLMRVQAVAKATGQVLATSDAVVPVSTEVDCRDCHTLGTVGADPAARALSPLFMAPATPDRVDVEAAAKHNILALHDFKHGTPFLLEDKPVFCAACHGSNALGTTNAPGVRGNMSNAMHGFHGRLQMDTAGELVRDGHGEPVLLNTSIETSNDQSLFPTGPGIPMEQNCFSCHPGKITQCFRGAMYTAGQTCDNCHGDMLAVGGEFELASGDVRDPWFEEPKCSSCHTGHGEDPVGNLAYDPSDPAATPIEIANSRFAENPGTLYRNSLDGHAQLFCEACHGSPHAIWPNRDPNANDNVPAIQLQGHAGTLRECSVCHESNAFPNGTLDGPHGMHPVNDPNWIKSKGDFYHEDFVWRNGNDQCAACHGSDHLGTRLSRVPVDRVLRDADGVVRARVSAGDVISCDLCHSLSKSFED